MSVFKISKNSNTALLLLSLEYTHAHSVFIWGEEGGKEVGGREEGEEGEGSIGLTQDTPTPTCPSPATHHAPLSEVITWRVGLSPRRISHTG